MRLLTLARDLRRRKAREREALFVAEGVRAVEEVARSPLSITGVLVGPSAAEAPRGAALLATLAARGLLIEEVSDRDFASAADTDSPQGMLAIATIPTRVLPAAPPASLRVLVLDAVQDPGNVGTLVRTAAALGVTATVALPGTVDLWNAKVVRSAMGAQCHHEAFAGTAADLAAWCAEHGVARWGADHRGDDVGAIHSVPSRLALVVGNEGNGMTDDVRTSCDRLVAIPITGAVESLNVGVAAGILLHALRAGVAR
jgi:TrmH family RNA methyltransferase